MSGSEQFLKAIQVPWHIERNGGEYMPCKAVLCCRVCKDHKASIIVIITENEEAHLLCSWSDWWKYMDGNASIFLVIPHKQEVGRWSSFGAGVGIGGKFYRKQVGKLNHKNPYVTYKNAEDVLTRLEQRKRQAPTHAKRRWRSLWKLVQAPLVAQDPRSYHIFLTAEYLQHPQDNPLGRQSQTGLMEHEEETIFLLSL